LSPFYIGMEDAEHLSILNLRYMEEREERE